MNIIIKILLGIILFLTVLYLLERLENYIEVKKLKKNEKRNN